jgi:hypothetical protein
MNSLVRTVLLTLTFLGAVYGAHADPIVAPSELQSLITKDRNQVAEFRAIREWAEKKGIHVWLAGGSAAGFARYVKMDRERTLLAEAGKPAEYFESRFGFRYYQIYRTTQDADIVIDAGEAEAIELEHYLHDRFPYLQGAKSVWEVRLLKTSRGTGRSKKDALIDNFDFRGQNSDSYSTGMIELTEPSHGESVVRDLFDWKNVTDPRFLTDIAAGKITFYESADHALTTRAKEGLNPEVLSVIRYFTKAFQYGAELDPVDVGKVERIVQAFDPHNPALAEAKRYLLSNAGKVYAHAEDLERAYRTLGAVGLLAKLQALTDGNPAGVLLRRRPLVSRPVGEGNGRRAHEIFGDGPIVVTHETRDFTAFESITRSRRGAPNVFESRRGYPGEFADHGDGFYLRHGEKGGVGNGWAIHFLLAPNAVENVDFSVVKNTQGGTTVIVKNRNALRVVDSSIRIGPVEYFQMLFSDGFGGNNRGALAMFEILVQSDLANLSDAEATEIRTLIDHELADKVFPFEFLRLAERTNALRGDVLRWKAMLLEPERVKRMLTNGGGIPRSALVDLLADSTSPITPDSVAWMERVASEGPPPNLVRDLLSQDRWAAHPSILRKLIEGWKRYGNLQVADEGKAVAQYLFSNPIYLRNSELFSLFFTNRNSSAAIDSVLEKYVYPELIHLGDVSLLGNVIRLGGMAEVGLLRSPLWREHPELVLELIHAGYGGNAWSYILSDAYWQDHLEPLEALLALNDASIDRKIDERFLRKHERWPTLDGLKKACGGVDPTAERLRAYLKSGHRLPPNCHDLLYPTTAVTALFSTKYFCTKSFTCFAVTASIDFTISASARIGRLYTCSRA